MFREGQIAGFRKRKLSLKERDSPEAGEPSSENETREEGGTEAPLSSGEDVGLETISRTEDIGA